MVFGELSGEDSTEGKALAAVSVVGDGDAVGLRVVSDGMDAGHLIVADAVDKQLIGLVVLGSVDMSVVPYGGAGLPRCLAVEVVDDILRQGDGGARRCVELMDMMGFGHLHVVLWELVHDFGQILIDGREDRHANGEVTGPKERLLAVLAERLHISLVVFHPAGRAAHHLDIVGKSAQIVAVGSRGVCELYGDIGRRKGGAVEVVLVVDINLTNNLVATLQGDLLDHVSHLAVANQSYLHVFPELNVSAKLAILWQKTLFLSLKLFKMNRIRYF